MEPALQDDGSSHTCSGPRTLARRRVSEAKSKRTTGKGPPEKPKSDRLIVKVPEDEVVRTSQSITAKQPPETDKGNEKSKKNKKSKSDAKAGPNSSCHDGKEVDEGAWETKISHKEKRQHRKRDKVLTGSGSLGFN